MTKPELAEIKAELALELALDKLDIYRDTLAKAQIEYIKKQYVDAKLPSTADDKIIWELCNNAEAMIAEIEELRDIRANVERFAKVMRSASLLKVVFPDKRL